MTQQRANILNEFYAGASGRSDGFRYYKNASTLPLEIALIIQKLALHKKTALWRKCKLQTFFAKKQHIRYFVVDDTKEATRASDASTKSLDSGEADFFKLVDEDVAVAEADAKAEANIVHGFDSHRSAVIPWLRRTGIEEHTRGLKKDEMHASFVVPKIAESEPELFLMLEIMDEIFIEAHS
ncbi:uncharacterized protein LY89DRAFT_742439 [Mollisia scopiformis]|uniref:Uncharacterized protein n=1 Tax=Mollisia scopiformis TaxID=149040 RepID=A0A132B5I1_MOLSC|nr:uncharacterized protein LY89DRAFT_742439 [Mollisia scopiformis]KUJ07668.1 hypothetical protein LY89DRAFT_742439 [Mollisia scopiformis]